MNKEITTNNISFQLDLLKEKLSNTDILPDLQNQLDLAEKTKQPKFHDFTDTDMMIWFLHEQKHLNNDNDRTKRTIKEYERELSMFVKHILTYTDDIGVDVEYIIEGSLFKSLEERHMRRYQQWLSKESPYVLEKGAYSPATLERKTTIIRSFFYFLHKNGYIENPIQNGLKIAKVRKEERPNRDLGPTEILNLLNGFKQMKHYIMFSIVHVLTTTGIRNEEFCTLLIEDFKQDTILGGYYLNVTGKGNKRRQVPLNSKVVETIKMFRYVRGLSSIEESEPGEPLFTTNRGKAFVPSSLSQYVKKEINSLYKELGRKPVTITPHHFRHAFAIISRLSNVDLYSIMNSLGHNSLLTTEIYLEKVFERENHAIHKWKSELLGEYI